MDAHRKFYDDKAREYGAEDSLGAARYRRAVSIAGVERNHRVLDVGCKRCQLLAQLGSKGVPIRYTGVDIAEESVVKNRAIWPEARFETVDITDGTPFEDASFDRVFALEVMEHVPAPAAMLEEVHRLLAPGGLLLLSVPNPYFWSEILFEILRVPDTQGHLYAWADANLRRLLEFTGFEVVRRIGTYFDLPHRFGRLRRSKQPPIIEGVPPLIARSRIYACRPR